MFLKFKKLMMVLMLISVSQSSFAGETWATGKVTSLLSSGTNPAIRLSGNISPDKCDGGTYGWIYFSGTAEEKSRVFATALAMSLAGKTITVYTNGDGGQCRIRNIQITSGIGQ